MNGSPEHQDASSASPTSAAGPPSAAPPSAAPPSAAPPPAAPPSAAPPSAAPPSAAPAAPAPAAAPAAPAPAAPTSAAPPPRAGQAAPSGFPGGMPRLQRKSPFLAGLLSLMPGIGQIYVGYYKLGFLHNVVFGTTIAFLAQGGRPVGLFGPFGPFRPLVPAVSIFLAFFIIYNIVDAVRRATLYNMALDGVDGIELPNMNVALPKFEGSVGGGVALIAFGILLLLNTLLGVPLDWLASWWPMGLIVLGGYLLAKAKQDRRDADPPSGGSS